MEKPDKKSIDRRSFLKVAAGSGAALVASTQAMSAQQSERAGAGSEAATPSGVEVSYTLRAGIGLKCLSFRD